MKYGFYFSFILLLIIGSVHVSAQPVPPQNLTAIQQSSPFHPVYVKLNWISASTMVRFNLYRKDGAVSDTGSFVRRVSGIRGLSFNDMHVMPGRTYSYYVTAVNMQGESDPSNTVEITLTAGPGGGGTVTGIITDDNTNLPVPLAMAVFHNTTGFMMGIAARADSQGVYHANLPAGTYFMKTMARDYYLEFYDNVPTITQATPIVISEGTALTINVGLAPYVPPVIYTLSGSVKDSLGNPLVSMIKAYNVRHHTFHRFMLSAFTDSLGNYTMNVREGDTLVVMATPFNKNFYPEFYNDKHTFAEADRIPVSGNITDIDFVLSHKPVYQNGISGLVAANPTTPVESFVSAFRKDIGFMRRYVVSTDAAGVYNFTNLIPGKYILRADPKEGYLPTYFRYDGTPTLDWREADSVIVEATGVITGINFNVMPLPSTGEAIIAGDVSSSTGENLEAAYVYAVNSNGEIAGYSITNGNGQFIIDGLNSGEYKIYSDKPEYNFTGAPAVTVDYAGNIFQTASLEMIPLSVTGVSNPAPQVVTNYQLYQNYPNPFNPVTSIRYSLSERSNVKLTVYNILGVKVTELVNEAKDAGTHQVTFDATGLSSGVYFYKLETGKFTQTRKLTLIK